MFACAVALVIEEEQREIEQSLLRDSLYMLWDSRKRKSDNAEGHLVTKRRYIQWDRDRAQQCIMEDYLGPVPKFNEDGFKRMFHVSRQNYDIIKTGTTSGLGNIAQTQVRATVSGMVLDVRSTLLSLFK